MPPFSLSPGLSGGFEAMADGLIAGAVVAEYSSPPVSLGGAPDPFTLDATGLTAAPLGPTVGVASLGNTLSVTGRVVQADAGGSGALLLPPNLTYTGSAGRDILLPGTLDGNGVLINWVGNDLVSLGAGRDRFFLGDGDDTGHGGLGNDTLWGGKGSDRLLGEAGDDVLHGGEGGDALFGQEGNDLLIGGKSDDSLTGGAGNDSLFGGDGKDRLFGQDGDDLLQGDGGGGQSYGGAGRDTLQGGLNIYGGEDADTFIYSFGGGRRPPRIRDFEQGLDVIDMRGTGATELISGQFTGVAGELRFVTRSVSRLRLDVDGDGISDGDMEVWGVTSFTRADFIFD